MEFHELRPSDRAMLEPYLAKRPFVDTGFTALYYIADYFRLRWCLTGGALVVSFDFPDHKAYALFGTQALAPAARALCENGRVQFILAPEEDLDAYRNLQGFSATIARTPGYADYVCRYEDFVSLVKRLSPEKYKDYRRFTERNHCAVREIGGENVADARLLMDAWCAKKNCADCLYGCERDWVYKLLDAWAELPAKGLLVDVDGEPQAFCVAEQCGETMLRLVGKPVGPQQGMHVFMGVEAARRLFPAAKYVNSGPDSDLPGLAFMKRKFKPFTKVEKYVVDLEQL